MTRVAVNGPTRLVLSLVISLNPCTNPTCNSQPTTRGSGRICLVGFFWFPLVWGCFVFVFFFGGEGVVVAVVVVFC